MRTFCGIVSSEQHTIEEREMDVFIRYDDKGHLCMQIDPVFQTPVCFIWEQDLEASMQFKIVQFLTTAIHSVQETFELPKHFSPEEVIATVLINSMSQDIKWELLKLSEEQNFSDKIMASGNIVQFGEFVPDGVTSLN